MNLIPKTLIAGVERAEQDASNHPTRTENIRLANYYALEVYRSLGNRGDDYTDRLIQMSIMHSLLAQNQVS